MIHVLFTAALVLLMVACQTAPAERSAARGDAVLALVGGRVQPSPGASAIGDGVVLIEGSAIRAVGARRVLDCTGATVSAGFWNSHVHFIQPTWNFAASAPVERLATGLRAMLTSYGFVHVVDTGSSLSNTIALRGRIDTGEIAGPSILIAGGSLAPVKGSPYYILPMRLPEPASAGESEQLTTAAIDAGADGVKLFSGSWAAPRSVVLMEPAVVRAAVDTAHRRAKFAIAHPSNSPGARIAIEGGVDILAHTFPGDLDGAWDRSLPAAMVQRSVAMVPTLKIFPHELRREGLPPAIVERVLGVAQAQLRAFAEAGGQVLFGTDVGYMADDDPTDEYVYMQAAGLSYAQILVSLTTAPAQRFGRVARTGRLAAGLDADVTVVDGQPEADIRALARVRYTLRHGRVLFERSR
jgi:imidazolonepropionase-like amidohydrolase